MPDFSSFSKFSNASKVKNGKLMEAFELKINSVQKQQIKWVKNIKAYKKLYIRLKSKEYI